MSNAPLVLNDLIGDGRHFAQKTNFGTVEIVDSLTGRVIAVVKDPSKAPRLEMRTMINGDEVWVDADVPEHAYKHTGYQVMAYSPWLVDLICEKISGGGSITKICKEKDMPSYVLLMKWRRQYPEVEEALVKARADRAEYLRDKAMEVVDGVVGEDEVPAARLKHDANKWAAGVDDSRYSPKSKVEATLTAPLQIVVATGIDRSTGIDRNIGMPQAREVGEIKDEKKILDGTACAGIDSLVGDGTEDISKLPNDN